MNKRTPARNVTGGWLLGAATRVLILAMAVAVCALCGSCKPKATESPEPQRGKSAGNAVVETSAPPAAYYSFAPAGAASTRAAAGTGRAVFESQNQLARGGAPGSSVAGTDLPPSAAARSNVIDLTRYYNATFYEVWHGGMGGNDLSTFPYGVRNLAGVDFDARGIVQVALMKPRFPQRVSGIPVERRCRRLHFLHASSQGYNLPPGLSLGRYMVTYEDGQTQDIPLILGENIADWWARRGTQADPPLVVAWTGTNSASKAMNHVIRLYKATWENPQSAMSVRTVGLVAEHETVAPFLVALTAEP